MCISNYIKKQYAILTYVLCVLFVIALGFSAYFTFQIKPKDISLGIIILLFADVALGILSIISMVSMFREVSRLHAREFPQDAIDEIELLKQTCDKMEKEIAGMMEK